MPLDFQPSSFLKNAQANFHWVMPCLVSVLLALKFHLIFLQNVNWDEFLYLSKVHAALRGDLSGTLQSAYVHAFTWLPQVSENEVDQIIAARSIMFVLQAVTCGIIFATGKKLFESHAAAFIGVLVYLTFSYTIDHGTSFRADPIAVFFLMAALWLLVRDRGGWLEIVSAGFLTALAGMVTIKSGFYVPTLGLAVLCLRGDGYARRRVTELFIFGATALMTFLALYAAHRYWLDAARGYSEMSMLANSAAKVILLDQLFPGSAYIVKTLNRDFLAWILLLAGFLAATGVALSRGGLSRGIGLLGLSFPLVTLAFYRNAFPYYYIFALASPALLVTGVVAQAQKEVKDRYFRVMFVVLAILLSAGLIKRYSHDNVDRTITQRQIIDTVHRMFPQPVPYIDRSSMISSFPKVGFFMSTWGMDNYRESGQPIMRQLLVEQMPVFLIANIESLILSQPQHTSRYSLIPEDVDVLRDNFIHHWGAIWVAGKKLDLAMADTEYQFEILVPGIYTVEGPASVVIDGVERVAGLHIQLASGYHTALSHHASKSATLRWGADLYRPSYLPLSDPIFVGF